MNRKSFRVAECLVNGAVGKYAIFADGTPKARIEKTETGDEYFCIQNPYAVSDSDGVKSYFKLHFHNMIRDAITAVREDYADTIQCADQSHGGFIHVVRFVDEEVGKEYREKTLAGWANTKFGYALRAGNKNSWSGYSLIGPKGEKLGIMSNTLKYRVFETEKAAMKYGEELLEIARGYAEQMVTAEDHKAAIEKCFYEVDKNYGKFSVIEDLMCDLVTGNGDAYKNEQKVLDEYGYDAMQCVIPEREDVIENEWYAQADFLCAKFMHDFARFSNWECKEVKEWIVEILKGFYRRNPEYGNFICKPYAQLITDAEKEFLFSAWLKCVEENRELLYPDSVAA